MFWSSTRKQIYYNIELWPQSVPQSTSSLKMQAKKGWKKGYIIYPLSVEDVKSTDLIKTVCQVYGRVGNLIRIFQISLWCLNHKTTLPHSFAYPFHSRCSKLQGRIFQKSLILLKYDKTCFKTWPFCKCLNEKWKIHLDLHMPCIWKINPE